MCKSTYLLMTSYLLGERSGMNQEWGEKSTKDWGEGDEEVQKRDSEEEQNPPWVRWIDVILVKYILGSRPVAKHKINVQIQEVKTLPKSDSKFGLTIFT